MSSENMAPATDKDTRAQSSLLTKSPGSFTNTTPSTLTSPLTDSNPTSSTTNPEIRTTPTAFSSRILKQYCNEWTLTMLA